MTTINDVAKLAGVSAMTVSRVMNDPSRVKHVTREKIAKAIKELNYIPNRLAQGLVSSSSKTIGVLFSNILNPVYSSIILGIEQASKDKNYNIIISNATDLSSSVRGLDMLLSKMVDGLIILPFEPAGMDHKDTAAAALTEMQEFYAHLKRLLEIRKIPCAIIDFDMRGESIFNVYHDYKGAASAGMEYLLACGYKNITFINSVLREGLWSDRENVYRAYMERAGLKDNINVEYCENNTESAFGLITGILKSNRCPGVFYCANDIIAIGAIQAASSFGLKIPGDVAIFGNDGINVGDMLVPQLSTVSINSLELGRKSLEGCINIISGAAADKRSLYIKPALLIRKSTLTAKGEGEL